MRPLDFTFIASGTFALFACVFYLRQLPGTPHRASRVATMLGLVFVNAAELALHRVPILDVALIVVALSLIATGLVLQPRR